jgi:threonine dehydrogenase-like Zn-dependent dehydrogenase
VKAVAIFPQSRETRLIEQAEPQTVLPHQARVKILEVGICGTDRHICSFQFGAPPSNAEHLILGHEALGQVLEVGSAVEHLKPGDLVVPEVRRRCTDELCLACQHHHQDFCMTGHYTERGIVGLHGYMTEQVIDDADYLHPVPPVLRSVAILTEPLTIAEKAYEQVLQIQQRLPWLASSLQSAEPGRGQTAVVLGAGPIGLLGAMLLLQAGYTTYVYSRSPQPNEKAKIVEEIGAHYVSSETTPIHTFVEQTGPIDLVYEAADAAPFTSEIIPALGRNSIVVFTSSTNSTHPQGVDVATAFRSLSGRNQVIVGTVNAGPAMFTAAIQHLEQFQQRWPHALSAIITQRHPIEHYQKLLTGRPAGIKHVITLV